MADKPYHLRNYSLTVSNGTDELTVSKATRSDWCYLDMVTNGTPNGEIVIRNKEMAGLLCFMLSQLVGRSDADL